MSAVETAIGILRERERIGFKRYGCSIDDATVDALEYAIEEAADLLIYLVAARSARPAAPEDDDATD